MIQKKWKKVLLEYRFIPYLLLSCFSHHSLFLSICRPLNQSIPLYLVYFSLCFVSFFFFFIIGLENVFLNLFYAPLSLLYSMYSFFLLLFIQYLKFRLRSVQMRLDWLKCREKAREWFPKKEIYLEKVVDRKRESIFPLIYKRGGVEKGWKIE